jgi:hypothetical protein
MTVVVPLGATSPFPLSPAFLISDPSLRDTAVIKAIIKARQIVVVCGECFVYKIDIFLTGIVA